MADETTQESPATSEETVKTPANIEVTPKPTAGESADTENQKLFTQADLDRIAANVRTEEKRKFDKKAADDKSAAQQQQLKENGEFKTLYEQAQARITELEGEIGGEKTKALRAEVAAEYRLPAAIAALLQGDTRDAMAAHAKELAKHVGPPRAPETEGGEKRKSDPAKSVADEQQRLRQSGRYAGL